MKRRETSEKHGEKRFVEEEYIMIKGVLIVNNHGKARLVKFYEDVPYEKRDITVKQIYNLVSKRSDDVCNFIEGKAISVWGDDTKVIYRHYATLYFVIAVDRSESELGILDLIQVFVECLDKCFENVCELDLIFHNPKVHNILDEIIMGGMVLETSIAEILKAIRDMSRLETQTQKPLPRSLKREIHRPPPTSSSSNRRRKKAGPIQRRRR